MRKRYGRRRITRRKRTLRRKGRRVGKRSKAIVWKRNGFPTVMYTTMRYVDVVQVNPGAGTPAYHTFRANSLFDPDYTSSGHQPFGRDVWANIYNRYQVVKSTVTAQYMPTVHPESRVGVPDYTPLYSGVAFIKQDDDNSISGTMSELVENNQITYKTFTSVAGWSKKLRSTYTQRSMQAEQRHQTQALMGSNPDDQHYYHVGCSSLTGGDMDPVNVLITITYFVKLFDRKDLPQS